MAQEKTALGLEDIDRVFRKWLKRIPFPLRPEDREAGYDRTEGTEDATKAPGLRLAGRG